MRGYLNKNETVHEEDKNQTENREKLWNFFWKERDIRPSYTSENIVDFS